MNRIIRQSILTIRLGDLMAQHRAECPIDVLNFHWKTSRDSFMNGSYRFFNELIIKDFFEAVILGNSARGDSIRMRPLCWRQNRSKIKPLCLPVTHCFINFQYFYVANHFIDGTETETGHNLPGFFSHEKEVVHDMLGLS